MGRSHLNFSVILLSLSLLLIWSWRGGAATLSPTINFPQHVDFSSSFNIRQLKPEAATERFYSGILKTGTGSDERGRVFQLPKQTIPAKGATWWCTCLQ
jgi:hypothetical protein